MSLGLLIILIFAVIYLYGNRRRKWNSSSRR